MSGQLHDPATLLLEKGAPGTPWTGGWVGSRAGLYLALLGHKLQPFSHLAIGSGYTSCANKIPV
jgi:hypothetical protein